MTKFFIVMMLFVNGHRQPDLERMIARHSYLSYAGCMNEAGALIPGMVRVGEAKGAAIHGAYLCMFHKESDADLAKTLKVTF